MPCRAVSCCVLCARLGSIANLLSFSRSVCGRTFLDSNCRCILVCVGLVRPGEKGGGDDDDDLDDMSVSSMSSSTHLSQQLSVDAASLAPNEVSGVVFGHAWP